tara:strand:+ start:5756 stop:6613 length:858 start_codon:yes stop_codon:yes gene_type:complete
MNNLKKNYLKKQIKFVCDIEMKSLKPGNVHKYSNSFDMDTRDFFKSSLIISKTLTEKKFNLGEKIFFSAEKIKNKIKKNTNLGIILMLAPIIKIVENEGIINKKKLVAKIKYLIKKQDINNSINIYKAISLTSPGGLGCSKKYDVNELPKTKLYKVMRFAKNKDLISKQYYNGYKEITNIGLPTYKKFYKKWGKIEWAFTGVYLNFLRKFNDSHIVRRNGLKIAKKVRNDANKYYNILENDNKLIKIKEKLLIFDKELKSKHINPGTMADLSVATVFFELVTKKQ